MRVDLVERDEELESQIARWRRYLGRRQTIEAVDVAELEDHLREHLATLTTAGLSSDEAFLVAVKRMGNHDALSHEFAREHSDRLWKQLVLSGTWSDSSGREARREGFVAVALGALAAVALKVPALFGVNFDTHPGFFARNIGVFVLPAVATFFAWKRGASKRAIGWFVGAFATAAVFANAYPFSPDGNTARLTALHLPIALWLLVGVAYARDRWNEVAGRMDFVRFTGEFFIYYALIALGGGVTTGFVAMMLQAAGVQPEHFISTWWVPTGAAGAVLVASWLVEAKQSVIENMAPVLARIFTPLFTLALLGFLGTLLVTGRGINVDRDILIAFDGLLAVVLGLVLYSVSARDPYKPAGPFDVVQTALVMAALVTDVVALTAIGKRIGDFGFTPNRVAALGENVLLMVNLSWTAVLYVRLLRGERTLSALERWQTRYLPLFAIWAAIVVVLFPPLFGFI